jgi:hypothetical protein
VQTFYQPLFSHSFPFSNFPLAILFPSKSFPHQNSQSKRIKPKPKKHSKAKVEGKKQKAPSPSSGAFYKQQQTGWSKGSWGGAGHCNRRNLLSCFSERKLRRHSCSAFSVSWPGLCLSAVLLFLFHGQGCAYLSLQVKAIKPHLTLLTSSSHRLFIICSPQLNTDLK